MSGRKRQQIERTSSGARAARGRGGRDRIDVACFGEVLWDIYENGPRRRIGVAASGDRDRDRAGADAPIARDLRCELGGAPSNVAVGLARLGVRASVVGGVGRDRFGDALAWELAAEGVETRHLVRLPNRTGITFVTRDGRGEPNFLFYRHESADVMLRADHVIAPMARATWVVVGTSTLMTPNLAAATDRFVSLAEAAGALVLVDLNVRAHLWPNRDAMRAAIGRLARRAAVVKASAEDLHAVAGGRAITWLAEHAPRATWLLTRAAGPASAVGAHGEVSLPAHRTKCVDATGAGDAFIAGSLAVLLAAGATPGTPAWNDPEVWTRALDVGHILGAKAVSRAGAVSGLVRLDVAKAKIAAAAKAARPSRRARGSASAHATAGSGGTGRKKR